MECSSWTERFMVSAMCGGQLMDRKIHGESKCVECSSWTERSMVRAMCGVQLMDRKINGESDVWSAAHGQKDPW